MQIYLRGYKLSSKKSKRMILKTQNAGTRSSKGIWTSLIDYSIASTFSKMHKNLGW